MEYYSAIKKNEILPFVTMWLDIEDIMISQIERQIPCDVTYIWNSKKKKIASLDFLHF